MIFKFFKTVSFRALKKMYAHFKPFFIAFLAILNAFSKIFTH